ncbi:MAG TPA: SRPBCC domain-containing protein [Hyphomonadaceae bacterium]|nr:SRPBCC domain-containing protein [Hyphomonadaceae bacterium]
MAQGTTTETLTKPHFGTFTIERRYSHKPERVFRAFEDNDAHYRWFVLGEGGWEIDHWKRDFRVGGRDHGEFRPTGHPSTFGNETWHLEIAKGQRIVDAYTMTMDGKPMSHSLATVELFPDGAGGCRLVYTEQGAYYGGEEDVRNRKQGCEDLFGRLDEDLRKHA